MYSSFYGGDFTKNGNVGDTTLRLDGFGYGTRETAPYRDSQTNNGSRGICTSAPDDGCKLVLGLAQHQVHILVCLVEPMCFPMYSSFQLPCTALNTPRKTDQVSSDGNRIAIPVVDEGSTSAKKSGGYMTRLILAPRMENAEIVLATKSLELGAKSHCQISQLSSEPSAVSSYSMSAISEPGSAAVSSDHKGSNTKKCKFAGCTKGARGATGLCIGHGAGKDARSLDATKVQRVERHSAKPMEEGDGVSIWDALKVPKERLISA
ncbi:UNVERIFIED_CONTAM: hypothetical protein Scaly_0714800 [Sesamum calycinum]|uniref:WRKY19-like zinc finger domain-containing protein n=1 Tax=Sesamum calycinum TaxID=2727403 RepID=A0AAW2R6X8_9LAMI